MTQTTGFVPSRAPMQPEPNGELIRLPQRLVPHGGAASPPLERPEWPEFGPLGPLVARAGVTDVLVNGARGVWVDAGEGLQREPAMRLGDEQVRSLAVRLVALGGRHVDEATPCADVRLRDGIRVHAVLPPLSASGPLLSIRVPRARAIAFDELEGSGAVSAAAAAVLRAAVEGRRNVLISGAAGSGKTTLLGALLALAPPSERIVTVEDVAELRVQHPHVVSLEARQPNLEGAGGVGLAQLVREALRMRPDRIVLGECRGAEVRELFSALNTGHGGGAGTLHANSLDDVAARIEALGVLAGLDAGAISRQAVSAIDLVVHLTRVGGARRVVAIGEPRLDREGRLELCRVPC